MCMSYRTTLGPKKRDTYTELHVSSLQCPANTIDIHDGYGLNMWKEAESDE